MSHPEEFDVRIVGGSVQVEMSAEINGASLNATIPSVSGVTEYKIGVTSAAIQLAGTMATRKQLWVSNLGDTGIWLWGASNIAPGASANNYDKLSAGNNSHIDGYAGPLYATVGNSLGVSIDTQWMGIAQIS